MAFDKLRKQPEPEPEPTLGSGADAPPDGAPDSGQSDQTAGGPEEPSQADWMDGLEEGEEFADAAAGEEAAEEAGDAGPAEQGLSVDLAAPEPGRDPDDALRDEEQWYQQWSEEMLRSLGGGPRPGPPQAGRRSLLAALVNAGAGPLRERLRRHRMADLGHGMSSMIDASKRVEKAARALDETAMGPVARELRSIMAIKKCGLKDAMAIVARDPRYADLRKAVVAASQDPAARAAYRDVVESLDQYRAAAEALTEKVAKTAQKGWVPDAGKVKAFTEAHEKRVGDRLAGVPPLDGDEETPQQRLAKIAASLRGNIANILASVLGMFRQPRPEPHGPQMSV